MTNRENIYAMLHEFRNWNREWDLYMRRNPDDADKFVDKLDKKYVVEPQPDYSSFDRAIEAMQKWRDTWEKRE